MSSWWCARTMHAQRLVAILQLRSKWVPSSNLLGRPRGVIGLSPVCRGGFRIQGIPEEHDKWELCAGVLAVQVALPACRLASPRCQLLQILMMLLGNVCYRCPPVIRPGIFPWWPVTRIFCCWKILSPQKTSPKAVNWVYGCSSQ
jgi:hypothetical protein